MTVIGLDDTDSRETGMCTTYLAARIGDQLAADWSVTRRLLVRLNPAVKHKTRGNAALAIHTAAPPEVARVTVEQHLEMAATDDSQTNPGVVIANGSPKGVPERVSEFARTAVRDHHRFSDARDLLDNLGYRTLERGNGRGLIGALAAVGAWEPSGDWTYECISYRTSDRRGTRRQVDAESVFRAADRAYPEAWDTVDHVEDDLVCVPHTPGPILHGIRGDDSDVVRSVASAIESEPVERRSLFVTNQGTDAHLRDGTVESVRTGRSYRLPGTVVAKPETREGGHVFFTIAETDGERAASLECVAFEPTKRFRDRVRALRVGDALTVCGEVSDGTLKLEKFAVRSLTRTERVTPTCPECERSMESAGHRQGYRCRDCETTAEGKRTRRIERDLEVGWYEVPPCARRHIAKPLIRGGFDAHTHPER